MAGQYPLVKNLLKVTCAAGTPYPVPNFFRKMLVESWEKCRLKVGFEMTLPYCRL